MDSSLLKPGDRISEYVLEERIGHGGFGDVWRARHHTWEDRVVAVKVPANAERAALLRREGMLQDLVRHRNAVEVLGMDAEHDPPYLIMEFVKGESLRARLARETRLATGTAVDLTIQVLGALDHAHARGVVHRDVKPENILIDETGAAKLTDFGLGRLLEDERAKLALSAALESKEQRGEISGTIAYMAPEQREPGRQIDGRTDLYALGIVLFEMLTGSRPEGGESPSDLVAGLDPRLDDVFHKCYCRIEKRYPSAAAMIAELAPLASRNALVLAAGPVSVPVAGLELLGPAAGETKAIPLGTGPFTLEGGAQIAHVDGAWWIVAPAGSNPTRVLPAHLPEGRSPDAFAEKVGSAPLKLAEGVSIAIAGRRGEAARYRFHEGRPAQAAELAAAGVGPRWVGEWRSAQRAFFVTVGIGLAVAAIFLGVEMRRTIPAILLGLGALLLFGRAGFRGPVESIGRKAVAAPPYVEPIGRPAGLMIRLVALGIDLVLFGFVAKLVGGVAPVAFLAYDWLLTGLAGATVGKYLLGLRVVREDGGPVGVGTALVRTVSKILSALPLLLGFLLAGLTPTKQALHDFFAGTRVIHAAE